MRFGVYQFGSVKIDGVIYHTDVIIDRGEVRKRRKTPSKKYTEECGHTPLSVEEEIPWDCQQLVIGTGALGALPVLDDVKLEAKRRNVKLIALRTGDAVKTLKLKPTSTNAVLPLTC